MGNVSSTDAFSAQRAVPGRLSRLRVESLEATDDVARIARVDHRSEADHDADYARVD